MKKHFMALLIGSLLSGFTQGAGLPLNHKPGIRLFKEYNSNNNDFLSKNEWDRLFETNSRRDRHFKLLDRNRDGKLSLKEFLTKVSERPMQDQMNNKMVRTEIFIRLDTNADLRDKNLPPKPDGLVTRSEFYFMWKPRTNGDTINEDWNITGNNRESLSLNEWLNVVNFPSVPTYLEALKMRANKLAFAIAIDADHNQRVSQGEFGSNYDIWLPDYSFTEIDGLWMEATDTNWPDNPPNDMSFYDYIEEAPAPFFDN